MRGMPYLFSHVAVNLSPDGSLSCIRPRLGFLFAIGEQAGSRSTTVSFNLARRTEADAPISSKQLWRWQCRETNEMGQSTD